MMMKSVVEIVKQARKIMGRKQGKENDRDGRNRRERRKEIMKRDTENTSLL
jgi:hypothetical protein